jgi:hypothetical protein
VVNLKWILRLGAFAALGLVGLSGCFVCEDEILERITSPDGKWTAIILTRGCGATTSEYMHVVLQDSNHKFSVEHDSVFATKYIHRLHVSWKGNDSLIIECENCTPNDVSHKVDRFGAIQINYR